MKEELGNSVLKWYGESGRHFPWREKNRSPYEILVAEVLLQKTRAEMVKEVYGEFLQEFPTIEKLASSEPEEIKSYLSKLGLQERRTEWLKKIAERIVEEFNGEVPEEEDEIKSLPGVGLYIGNAILCFGFGRKKPILDANTSRVVGRVFSVRYEGDLRRNKELKEKAQEMLPAEGVKEFNWALLDIGALLCERDFPGCPKCPLREKCDYYRADNVMVVPVGDYSFSKAVEDRIYACPVSRSLREPKYLALYQTRPTSAITHLGKVENVSTEENFDSKYKLLTFGDKVEEKAKVIHLSKVKEIKENVPYDGETGIQKAIYTSLHKIGVATNISDLY